MNAYRSNGGTLVPLEKVSVKPGWQGPQFFSEEKAKCFADLMQNDTAFPPIEVQETNDGFWVLNGIHRLSASRKCSFTHIPVEISLLK
jgi:hypothetical protein